MWSLTVLPIGLFLLGFPVYVVLLAASAVAVLTIMNVPPVVVHQIVYGGVANYALLAVPFFIFAGELMNRCGVSERLVQWVMCLIGHVRGSLGLTTIASSTMLGAVSGSSPATVAAVGKTLYEPLLRGGYGRPFSLGIITSSGSIAIVVPPSIAMILYGASAEQSIPKLFIGGILPGLLIALLMSVYVLLWVRRPGGAQDGDVAMEQSADDRRADIGFGAMTARASGALAMPAIVLLGIYLGFFSPTEAGGVACLYAILLGRYVYRSVTWRQILEAASESAFLTGQILIIVASAAVFAWILTVQGIPQSLIAWVEAAQLTPVMFLLVINLLLLVLGCFIDPTSAILVLTPILAPIVQALGIDLIHFGIIMTVNLSIGMFTPPFGLNIFVAQSVLNAKVSDIYRGLFGFFVAQVIALLIITYVPELSLFLVETL